MVLVNALVRIFNGVFEILDLMDKFFDHVIFFLDDIFEGQFLFDFPFELVLGGPVKSFRLFKLLDDNGFFLD
jgi:hypothetical protein